jgi:hypothetical protein
MYLGVELNSNIEPNRYAIYNHKHELPKGKLHGWKKNTAMAGDFVLFYCQKTLL